MTLCPACPRHHASRETPDPRRADFDSDFDITLRTFGRRDRNRDRIEGTVNGGGPEIYINTYRGEIRLRRR